MIDAPILLVKLVTLVLALVVASLAFHGYRRSGDEPMLYVAVGFVLLMGVPGLLGALFFVLPVGRITVGAFTQASEIIGMLSILYGLWMDPS